MPYLKRLRSCLDYYHNFFDQDETLLSHAADRNLLRLYEELFAGSHLINGCRARDDLWCSRRPTRSCSPG